MDGNVAGPCIETALFAPIFRGLSAGDVQNIVSQARLVERTRGGWFFHQDEPAKSLFLLLEGKVKVHQLTADGHGVLLRIMGPHELFGYRALIPGGTHPVSAQALTATRCLRWPAQVAFNLFHRHPAMALNALLTAVDHLIEFQSRCRDLATEPVERRVARTLVELGARLGRAEEGVVVLEGGIMQKDIGELTGTTVFSISRIFAEWKRQGVLRSHRGRIVLRDMGFLRRIATAVVVSLSTVLHALS